MDATSDLPRRAEVAQAAGNTSSLMALQDQYFRVWNKIGALRAKGEKEGLTPKEEAELVKLEADIPALEGRMRG